VDSGLQNVSALPQLVKCVDRVFDCSCGRAKQMPPSLRSSLSVRQLLLVSVCVMAHVSRLRLHAEASHVKTSGCGHDSSTDTTDPAVLQQMLLVPRYHLQLLSALNVSAQCLEAGAEPPQGIAHSACHPASLALWRRWSLRQGCDPASNMCWWRCCA